MANDSPAVVLYNATGAELSVADGLLIPPGTTGILSVGSDGASSRFLVVDVAGRQVIVGAAAAGSAPTGAPVRVAGSDGTAVRDLRTDSVGNAQVVGPALVGSAPTGAPVRVAGSDGSALRDLLTDVSGRVNVVGPAPIGTGPIGNPVLVAMQSATGTVQIPEIWTAHPTGVAAGLAVRNLETTAPTYYAVYDRIAPAANKYMATLFNTSSTRKVVIQRIYQYNWQFTGVTDNLLEQELRRITARTAGTVVTPIAEDTRDSLSAGITADTNSSAVTDSSLIKRIITGSAEAAIAGGVSGLKIMRTTDNLAVIYDRIPGTRGITLRLNQGLTIKNITSVTVGTCSYVIVFTDEAA